MPPRTGTREEWQAARERLLEREKQLTRRNDELARERQELPWVPIDKEYRFQTDEGTKTLAELFDADSDFNLDFGVSAAQEQVAPMLQAGAPPIVDQLAAECGTDPAGYLSERQALSAFALEDGVVYHTYATHARGAEIMMGFYPLLDRAPKGRNESGDSDFWIRRHRRVLMRALTRAVGWGIWRVGRGGWRPPCAPRRALSVAVVR